ARPAETRQGGLAGFREKLNGPLRPSAWVSLAQNHLRYAQGRVGTARAAQVFPPLLPLPAAVRESCTQEVGNILFLFHHGAEPQHPDQASIAFFLTRND